MDAFDLLTSRRPVIFFDPHCPPCAWMARLASRLSFGVIRREAMDSDQATAIYRRFPAAQGQMVLLHQGRCVHGRLVFAALPLTVIRYLASPGRRTGRSAAALPAARREDGS